MDPCTELSTLVVSYLWMLRDIFPEARLASDLRPLVALPVPMRTTKLFDAVLGDYGMIARLRNIAHRSPEERWSQEPEAMAGSRAIEASNAMLDRIVAERAQRTQGPAAAGRFAELRDWLRRSQERANQGDFEELQMRLLWEFSQHALAMVERFSVVPIRGANVTHETLTDTIAEALLLPGVMPAVAVELDYRPILVRLVGGDAELLDDPFYPAKLIAACKAQKQPMPFALVLSEESREIERLRSRRLGGAMMEPPIGMLPTRRAYAQCAVGVALSGGGIRSATFCLGVLQGLAGRNWLPEVDYLSTVSGGGYIGAWLLAWVKRRGSVASVAESLRGSHACADAAPRNPDPAGEHIRPIRLLREYSNYLAPAFSTFSADTWTIGSIWLRNTVLNLMVLSLVLMAGLMAPRLLAIVFTRFSLATSLAVAGASFIVTTLLIGFNLQSFDDPIVTTQTEARWWRSRVRPSERGDTPFVVVTTIVVPAAITVFFGGGALWQYASIHVRDEPAAWRVFMAAAASFLAGLVFTGVLSLRGTSDPFASISWKQRLNERLADTLTQIGRTILCGAAAAVLGAFLLKELWAHVLPVPLAESRRGLWIVLAFGPIVVLVIIMTVLVVYLGLEGLWEPDERREWWSRLGAFLGLAGAAWATVASISFFAPYAVVTAGLYASTLGLGWGVMTAVGASLAAGGQSNGINLRLDRNWLTSCLITAAPYIFILGFLVAISVLTHALMYALRSHALGPQITSMHPLPFSMQRYAETYWAFLDPQSYFIGWVWLALVAVAAALAWRVDVNEFSMHHFYKNRLVRAYLGASRSRLHRRPNSFTGLDMDDDIKLARFRTTDMSLTRDWTSDSLAWYAGPYPIINTTLNMTSGDELAWQERKGQSFSFTPLYCGFDFATKQTAIGEKVTAQFAYRPTPHFGGEGGVGIGTAMSISGAAANPNAGYHSSPAVAFLLTIFNARLGWWIGNPALDCWTKPSPPFGLFYLISELFGFSGVRRKYVNLSDGGHFDNMGLYELVRRRCRMIVICDGEQDDQYSFNGLAAAIRKCRVDFGVVIDISTRYITPAHGVSGAHVTTGTINYPGEGCGHLVYVKASLTGDEPVDIQEYRRRHPEFPHQTTADQFFDESQFESYRALGQHIADGAFPDWPAADPQQPVPRGQRLDQLFEIVRERCGGAENCTVA